MVLPCGSRSSTPITTKVPVSRAAAPSASVTGPGTVTAWSTSIAYHSPSPSQIRTESIQIGVRNEDLREHHDPGTGGGRLVQQVHRLRQARLLVHQRVRRLHRCDRAFHFVPAITSI